LEIEEEREGSKEEKIKTLIKKFLENTKATILKFKNFFKKYFFFRIPTFVLSYNIFHFLTSEARYLPSQEKVS
jgi:hypothetical protein